MLGKIGTDKITGFSGIVTGKCEYLTGCVQMLIQSKMKENGDFTESKWFDIDRIEIELDKPLKLKKTTNGFDSPAPRK